eukprot:1161962-Pelagomonas_calceolata.AAC.5
MSAGTPAGTGTAYTCEKHIHTHIHTCNPVSSMIESERADTLTANGQGLRVRVEVVAEWNLRE